MNHQHTETTMNNDDKTDGAAFPPAYNLTLRDYFAVEAMRGYMPRFNDDTNMMPVQLARMAYAIADAMVAVRKGNK